MQYDLNILKSLKNSKNTQNSSIKTVINPSEIMNISYNFSNINQMNININISSIKELMNEQSINPHIKTGSESIVQGNQQNDMNILNRDNEKESVHSMEDNISKYDKYSDRNREKEYQYLKRKFKPTQAIEAKNTRYYNRNYDRERNFNCERDKERISSNQNNDYGYYNKTDNTNTSRYEGNRRYYNPATSASNFSNYNYTRNTRTNYFNKNNNVHKPFNKSSNFSYKRDRERYSRSKSNSEGLSSRSRSNSRSISRGDEKSDSYLYKNANKKYNERKQNSGLNMNMNILSKENEHSLKSKKEIGAVNSSGSSESQSRSNSLRSSSSSSSYSSSSSKSFKREKEQEHEYTKTAYKFQNRNRGGMMSNNSYKQGFYNRHLMRKAINSTPL